MADDLPPWLQGSPGAWRLSVHAQPGASSEGCAGEHGGRLKLRIASPATDGRANDALVAFVAARLGVPRTAVRIERGHAARAKRVAVDAPLEAAAIVGRLLGA